MRNKIMLSLGVILLVILIVFISNNRNSDSEIMWHSSNLDHSLNIYSTNNQKEIQQAKQILNSATKLDLDNIPTLDDESDYHFWISLKPPSERTINCDVWFTTKEGIIFDINKQEYFYISYDDSQKLKTILENMISED